MKEDNTTIFNFIGSIASILSLFISVWLLSSIRRIKQFYLLNTRVPELIDSLSSSAQELSISLNTYNGMTNQIKKILADIDISVKSLMKKKVKREIKSQLKSLKKKIQKIEGTNNITTEKKCLGEIHLSVYKVIKEIEMTTKDSKWER